MLVQHHLQLASGWKCTLVVFVVSCLLASLSGRSVKSTDEEHCSRPLRRIFYVVNGDYWRCDSHLSCCNHQLGLMASSSFSPLFLYLSSRLELTSKLMIWNSANTLEKGRERERGFADSCCIGLLREEVWVFSSSTNLALARCRYQRELRDRPEMCRLPVAGRRQRTQSQPLLVLYSELR